MSDFAIEIEQLSKRYVIDHQRQPADGLRHVIDSALRSPLAWIRQGRARRSASREEFWALRDLDLKIRQGEVVGFIGRNGAGKSTLLKILSRITEPTKGRVVIRGRVASLLEVGTGFHQELTGRENVFLNGAILGMNRAEIARKFDEIVAFAEVERFLDTPVKRYSSGMQVRLAFAVAAHLEPEILIVDEVLAVGDAAFQKRCLGRMNEVASQEGRTVLFVSHSTGALSALCSRGVVLNAGRVEADTDIHSALAVYLNALTAGSMVPQRKAHGPRIERVTLDEAALRRGDFELHIVFDSPFDLDPNGGVVISDANGSPLIGTNMMMHPDGVERRRVRNGTLICRIPDLPLHSGDYGVSVWLADVGEVHVEELGVLKFHFASPDFHPGIPPPSAIGAFNVRASWCVDETKHSKPLCS